MGPVHPGSPAGEFSVIHLSDDASGWVVAGHHPNVLTYVALDEVPDSPTDLQVGLLGRHKRAKDARDLQVVHEEPWK
jgi:hypothetical protein